MPEGDTLRRTAAGLASRLTGHVVRSAEPAPLHRLLGRRVEGVDADGKHLLVRFHDGLVLHSHLGMNGAWHLYLPGQPWRRPRHRATAVLTFEDVVAVAFSAPVVELIRDERAAVGHLGPDILDDHFDLARVLELARMSDREEIGDLLLDQRVCAGIGNIYRCETLWLHRLDPWTSVGALSDDDLAGLYTTARRLMRESVTGGAPRRRAVHARSGRPCPRCTTLIRTRNQGALARITYYCPRCQGAPVKEAAHA